MCIPIQCHQQYTQNQVASINETAFELLSNNCIFPPPQVSSFLVIATAKQVLMQYEPSLLEEHGGPVRLNPTWAKSFLKRIGLHQLAQHVCNHVICYVVSSQKGFSCTVFLYEIIKVQLFKLNEKVNVTPETNSVPKGSDYLPLLLRLLLLLLPPLWAMCG